MYGFECSFKVEEHISSYSTLTGVASKILPNKIPFEICLISSRCCVQQEAEKENLKCYPFPFPAGTIWMQEILPLVLNGGDLTPLQTIANWDRVPWLEEKRLAKIVDQLPAPRAMVTHFPYHLMPPSLHTSKAKVSFLSSHPADTEYNFEICFSLR